MPDYDVSVGNHTNKKTPEENARGYALVEVMAYILEKMIDQNHRLDQNKKKEFQSHYPYHTIIHNTNEITTRFHAEKTPSISIHDYLLRILKYASCSTECFVLALIYIDRLVQSTPHNSNNNFQHLLTSTTIHRIVMTSIVLAAKFFDDQYYNNAYYAKVGGIPCIEMNRLEIDFLFYIKFNLYVSPDIYMKYYNELANHSVFLYAYVSHSPYNQTLLPYISNNNKNINYIPNHVNVAINLHEIQNMKIKKYNNYYGINDTCRVIHCVVRRQDDQEILIYITKVKKHEQKNYTYNPIYPTINGFNYNNNIRL